MAVGGTDALQEEFNNVLSASSWNLAKVLMAHYTKLRNESATKLEHLKTEISEVLTSANEHETSHHHEIFEKTKSNVEKKNANKRATLQRRLINLWNQQEGTPPTLDFTRTPDHNNLTLFSISFL